MDEYIARRYIILKLLVLFLIHNDSLVIILILSQSLLLYQTHIAIKNGIKY
jgi:hypothetical protein